MKTKFNKRLALGVSAALGFVFAAPSFAQSTGAAGATASNSLELEEIVVTARRKEESLQDVPTVVNVVTAESLTKLNIHQFEEIQALVPGLNLSSLPTGFSTKATVRGIAYDVESSAAPTVAFFMNDATTDSNNLFQSMYDIGQIEVLRGPQGTLRGTAAPSGSITVTTHRPDLYNMGGYVSASGGTTGNRDANGAFGTPIIDGMLAVRVAGIMNNSRLDGVHSVNNTIDPSKKARGGRISLRFEPIESVSSNFTYHYLDRDIVSNTQVESLSLLDPTAPVVAPVISPSDRLGIRDGFNTNHVQLNIFDASVDWRFVGQKLSYVGSYATNDFRTLATQDAANHFANLDYYQFAHTNSRVLTHEVRLASEELLLGMFEYTVGGYFADQDVTTDLLSPQPVIFPSGPPFFGATSISQTPIFSFGGIREISQFGSLTWHIDDKTELTGGLRHIEYVNRGALTINTATPTVVPRDKDNKTFIYNGSFSHHFSDDFMAYANVGTAYRAGPDIIGVFRAPTPNITKFTSLDNEKSTSYEIGAKATFMDKRLRMNAAVFHQDFTNYIYRGPKVWYIGQGNAPSTFNFGSNVDVKANGLELESAFQITPRFNVGGAFSYAKSEIKSGVVACTDINGDGKPDINPPAPTLAQLQASVTPGEAVAQCAADGPAGYAPKWSATLQSEYSIPVLPFMDAYLRGLLSYYPSTDGDPNSNYDNVSSYGLLNLFTGVRDPNGAWEVSIYAKNLTNTRKALSVEGSVESTPATQLSPSFVPTGVSFTSPYVNIISMTPKREFGLSLRYAFGAR